MNWDDLLNWIRQIILAILVATSSVTFEDNKRRVPPILPEPTPVVTPKPTAKPIRSAWIKDPEVSWYGPRFYCTSPTPEKHEGCLRGKLWLNGTACGQLYTTSIIGVAHRSLPCGTLVVFRWRGKEITVPVIDRGPYVEGRTWDLSGGLCVYLEHCFTGPIEWRFP